VTPEQWARQKEVFSRIQSAGGADRDRILDELCGTDIEFRNEMNALVRGLEAEDTFLERGAGPAGFAAGAILAGRFELLRLEGEGGMGRVWRARDLKIPGERVAVKLLHDEAGQSKEASARFKRELQLARRIAHPNVCKLYDLFEDETGGVSRLLVSMELVEGETLADRIKRDGRIEPATAMEWMRQLCAGVEAAHQEGVVHRDLKPANVILSKGRSGGERVVLTDFGLARRAEPAPGEEQTLTGPGVISGTPQYMAPEQIRGDPATGATDVYALGLILYEMLRGEQPFAGRSTLESWMRRVREGPPNLSLSVAGVSRHVDDVIARCLSYDPKDRFASAGALWDSIVRGSSVPSRMVSWKAAAVLAGIGGLFGAWTWAGRFQRTSGPDAVVRLGDIRRDLAEGAAVRAAQQLRRMVKETPSLLAAYPLLAEAELELDQNTQARETVMRAASIGGNHSAGERSHVEGVRSLLLRDCRAAESGYRSYVAAADAVSKPFAMVSLARALERCDQVEEAQRELQLAARLDPRNAAIMLRLSSIAHRRRQHEESERLLGDAESEFRERANFEGVGEVMLARGMHLTERNELGLASERVADAARLAEITKNPHQQIRALFQQSNIARRRGDLVQAKQYADEASALARQNDLETLTLQGIFAAANVHTIKSQYSEAIQELQGALEIAVRYRDEENQARANLSLAVAYQRTQQIPRAERTVAAALPFYERVGHGRNLASASYIQGQLDLSYGRNRNALARFQAVLAEGEKLRDSSLEGLALGGMGTAGIRMGRFEESYEFYKRIGAEAHRASRSRAEAYAVLSQADALSAMGRFDAANSALAAAKRLIDALDGDARAEPANRYLLTAATVAQRRGNSKEAVRLLDGPLRVPGISQRLDALLLKCESLLGAEDKSGAEGVCREAMQTAEGNSVHAVMRAKLLAARGYLANGERRAAEELAGYFLSNVSLEDAPFEVLLARRILADARADESSRKKLSQTFEQLRTIVQEPVLGNWLQRPDNRRLFEVGQGQRRTR